MDSTGEHRTILVLNGPNLNLLGTREPETYGSATLADADGEAERAAKANGLECRFVQSNHEGELIDAVHAARHDCAGIVVNAGGFTHTSVALRDAIAAVALPTVEVHVSNVHAREEFRHHSLLSAVCETVIVGAGIHGYALAVEQLAHRLR
ncbi:MAG: type II 3-dehydroquinate dehydratase [Nocardioidaceae bacterium]